MSWGMVGAAAVSVVGGAISADAAAKGNKAAGSKMEQMLAQYNDIKLPSVAEQELNLQTAQLMGEITPEAEESLELGPSQMEELSTDEALRGHQLNALQKMAEISEGGLSEGDLAEARQAQRQVDASNQSRQKAILNNMAQRGVLGSGMELAAKLGSNQVATEQQANSQDELIKNSQNRALQAMSQQSNMAGNLRSQDFSEDSAKARAADAIAKSNLANQAGVQQRNIATRNQAQIANLAAKQAQEQNRIATLNNQQQYNKELKQKNLQNQMSLADSKAGVMGGQAKHAQATGNTNARMISGVASGLTDIAGSFAGGDKDDDLPPSGTP